MKNNIHKFKNIIIICKHAYNDVLLKLAYVVVSIYYFWVNIYYNWGKYILFTIFYYLSSEYWDPIKLLILIYYLVICNALGYGAAVTIGII